MVCRERERKKCRDQQVFPVETKKWICLFYNKLSARQCLCTQMIVVELIFFWHSKPREESKSWLFFFSFSFFWSVRAHACCSVCLSVWLHAQTRASTLVNTHMSKVFVTLLTHCFSVLLLPWKHRNHGNKRCGVLGGWGGVWFFFLVFLMRLGFS